MLLVMPLEKKIFWLIYVCCPYKRLLYKMDTPSVLGSCTSRIACHVLAATVKVFTEERDQEIGSIHMKPKKYVKTAKRWRHEQKTLRFVGLEILTSNYCHHI